MATKKRDYKREAATESEERKERRRKRMKARYEAIKDGRVKRNDGKVVGHKKKLSKGGSNGKKNTRIESPSCRKSKRGTSLQRPAQKVDAAYGR